MAYTLTLTPAFTKDYDLNGSKGYRLQVTATIPGGSQLDDAKVFRYYEYPPDTDGTSKVEFTGVCSWPDMLYYPADAPRDSDNPKVFRLYTIDIVVETETLANQIWELVQQDVTQLLQTYSSGQTLITGAPVTLSS